MIGDLYQPTVLTMVVDDTPTYSGAGETDLIYQKGSLSGLVGLTWCNDAVDSSSYDCDQQYVKFDSGYAITKASSCHETGHAVGLVHGQDSYPVLTNVDSQLGCMRTPYLSSASTLTPLLAANLDVEY